MRTLYLWFVLAFAVMAYGFWPSVHGDFGPLDWLRWVHGALAAGWMALLVAQAWAIGHDRWRWHKAAGRASRWMVPPLLVSSFFLVRDELGPHSHFGRDLRLSLAWGDFLSLMLFAGFYVAAYRHRRRFALHARCMAATVFVVLPPALGRAYGPIFGGLEGALQPAYLTVDTAMLFLILWDASRRRFLAPIPIALAGTILLQTTMTAAPRIPPFVAFATALGYPPA